MELKRRQFIISLAAATLQGRGAAAVADGLTPEAFGAKGDGNTNDTGAFAALSAYINSRGGGTIVLRPVTYIVGKQWRSRGGKTDLAFAPMDILHFIGCTRDVIIRGNGATLRLAPGLLYGGFDRQSGNALPDARENLQLGRRAVPYLGVIHAENCTGAIEIADLEIDGQLNSLRLGGKYSDAGWQAGGSGVRLIGGSGPERLSRIFSHHHPQDGILLKGAPNRTASTIVSDCVCEKNGRVAASVTGGRNYSFERCKFRQTGRAGLRSSPAAGVDIEPEGGGSVRNIRFSDCEFSDNSGFGLVAGGGNAEGVTFANCSLIGTSNWSAWPNARKMRFTNCLFVGQMIHAHGDSDPQMAAQFLACTFTDNPLESPTRQVFEGRINAKPIAILTKNPNVFFSQCRFNLTHAMVLPMSGPDVIYADCTMSQASPASSRPAGIYLGITTITGNADLTRSIIRGTVILNGRKLPALS